MEQAQLRARAAAYTNHLIRQERSAATVAQYRRDILCFLSWLEDEELTKEAVIRYKEKLQSEYKAASVNTKLAALNGFFTFLERSDLRVKRLRLQRQAYCSQARELTREEYQRLVRAARQRSGEKLSLLLQTICGTGIRVSELSFITVEAVEKGEAVIYLKGKIRTVLIPERLRGLLERFVRRENIPSGPVFVTRNGRPLHRSNIWRMMKALCAAAGVAAEKVFPHNLRHLFARCFYGLDRDIVKLADILGHSSIDTTRIYIVSTGAEHRTQMDALGLALG